MWEGKEVAKGIILAMNDRNGIQNSIFIRSQLPMNTTNYISPAAISILLMSTDAVTPEQFGPLNCQMCSELGCLPA